MQNINNSSSDDNKRFLQEFRSKYVSNSKSAEEIEGELVERFGNQPISRLELFYNPETNALLLQGNQEALLYFRDLINGLAESKSGHYFQLDEYTSLTDTNLNRWIIRRVDDDDYLVDPSTWQRSED